MAHHRGRAFPSSKLAKHRRNRRLIYISVIIILLAGLVWGTIAFAKSKYIAITDIKVTGTKVIDPKEVMAIAHSNLDTNYLYFISKNNSILYPRKKIKGAIMLQFPRVKEVNMAIEDNNVLHIELSERKPFALWCKEPKENKENCYFLDDQGFVYAPAPNFYGNVFFKYYDVVNEENPVGERYMTGDHLKVIQDFARQVSRLGLVPVGLKVRTVGEYDFMLEQGGKIIFSDKDTFAQTFDNLSTLVANQAGLKDASNIDYIDLRFGNKIYYKLKNSSILTP